MYTEVHRNILVLDRVRKFRNFGKRTLTYTEEVTMMATVKYRLAAVMCCMALCLASCSADEEGDQARLKEMREDILQMVGTPTCAEEGSCRSVGFGAKPCGGPWEYLIYSVENVDEQQLLERVREYNDFEEKLNAKYGYVSDCTVPEPPVLGCRDGRCVDLQQVE